MTVQQARPARGRWAAAGATARSESRAQALGRAVVPAPAALIHPCAGHARGTAPASAQSKPGTRSGAAGNAVVTSGPSTGTNANAASGSAGKASASDAASGSAGKATTSDGPFPGALQLPNGICGTSSDEVLTKAADVRALTLAGDSLAYGTSDATFIFPKSGGTPMMLSEALRPTPGACGATAQRSTPAARTAFARTTCTSTRSTLHRKRLPASACATSLFTTARRSRFRRSMVKSTSRLGLRDLRFDVRRTDREVHAFE